MYVFLEEVDQYGLKQVRMCLDLVNRRRDLGGLEQILGRLGGEIADSDTSNLASMYQLLKNRPGVGDIGLAQAESLSSRVYRGEGVVGVFKSHRPVNLHMAKVNQVASNI